VCHPIRFLLPNRLLLEAARVSRYFFFTLLFFLTLHSLLTYPLFFFLPRRLFRGARYMRRNHELCVMAHKVRVTAHIHAHTHTHTHTQIHMRSCQSDALRVRAQSRTHARARARAHTHTHMRSCQSDHVSVRALLTNAHTHTHTHTHTNISGVANPIKYG